MCPALLHDGPPETAKVISIEPVSKPLEGQEDAGKSQEADIHEGVILPAVGEATEAVKPRIGSLDDKTSTEFVASADRRCARAVCGCCDAGSASEAPGFRVRREARRNRIRGPPGSVSLAVRAPARRPGRVEPAPFQGRWLRPPQRPAAILGHRRSARASSPCRTWCCRCHRPLFSTDERRIHRQLVKIQSAELPQLAQQRLVDVVQNPFAGPLLQSTPTGRWRREVAGNVSPTTSVDKQPDDRLQTLSIIGPRPSPARRRNMFRQKDLDSFPKTIADPSTRPSHGWHLLSEAKKPHPSTRAKTSFETVSDTHRWGCGKSV